MASLKRLSKTYFFMFKNKMIDNERHANAERITSENINREMDAGHDSGNADYQRKKEKENAHAFVTQVEHCRQCREKCRMTGRK